MAAYPAPAVGQVSLITFKGTLNDQLILSTFKYQITTVGTDVSWDVAATNLYTTLNTTGGFIDKYLAMISSNLTLEQVWIQLIFPTRYQKLVFPNGKVGGFIAAASTSNLAAVITRRGVLANKKNVGGLHVPYANTDPSLSNGLVSPAMLSAMGNFGSLMLNAQVPATGLTVWTPGLLPAKPTSISQWVPLYQTIPQTTARVMRRRTVGVGK